MKKILVVARWEYFEKVKSKAFLIGLLVTPLIMLGMGILPSMLASHDDERSKVIGLIDLSGQFSVALAERMQGRYSLPDGQPNYIIKPFGVGQNIDLAKAVSDAEDAVTQEQIEGYCILPESMMTDSVLDYRSQNVGDFRLVNRLEENLRGLISERKLIAMGLDPKLLSQLDVPLSVRSVKITESGEREESGFLRVFFSAYVFLMMQFFLIFTSGQMLVRSVIEEKSNRIVEVLVSSCSPTELMAGKVLGLSGLGFTQIGFWSVIGLAASVQFGIDLVTAYQALLLILYFVLGYLFYAAVFIAAGSPVTTEQEAQQINSYLVLFLVLPIALAIPAIQNPNALWLQILSFIPLFTPSMMALRIPIQTPSAGEIVATSLIMVGSIYGMMVAAGRIFRIAILATGKRPGLGEIIRWARTG